MFFIYFFSLLFTGLATIAGLILFIVGVSGYKTNIRNTGLILLGVGLIGLFTAIIVTVRATVNKVKEAVITPFQNFSDSLTTYAGANNNNLLEDDRYYLMDDTCSNPYIKISKEASYKNNLTVSDNYFTYFGSSDFSRIPVIYPFSIHSWDGKNYGTLVSEENIPDVKHSTGKEENIIFNITDYNFDTQFILIKSSETQSNKDNTKYVYFLYDMKRKFSKEFSSEKELLKAAEKAGYKGENELVSLWDYDARF